MRGAFFVKQDAHVENWRLRRARDDVSSILGYFLLCNQDEARIRSHRSEPAGS